MLKKSDKEFLKELEAMILEDAEKQGGKYGKKVAVAFLLANRSSASLEDLERNQKEYLKIMEE